MKLFVKVVEEAEGKFIKISVQDSGVGISMED